MIKKLTICLMVLLLLVTAACGERKSFSADITCKQILDAATSVGEQHLNVTQIFYDTQTLDPYKMSIWADGAYKECEEFDLLDDYALCYSNDNTTYEISVLKAKDEADVQKIKEVLERRKQTLSGGDKAAYDPDFNKLLKDSRILTEENFVILLITSYNDAAITAIENLKE